MEQRNNQQDRIIFEIETLLNKMSNQVNFLIRKEMPMNQLDVDLLMENTRKLYDTICSIELGVRSEELGVEESRDITPVASEELGVEESRDVTPVASEELGVRSEELEESEKEEKEEDSGIRAYRIIRENIPTLGDMLEQSEDKSLAARLQRKPVSDLITAIGINDKFLFLNELFGGSMEKYNKSIRSLNSFSTLLGAKTYMSELQIEFQWDCTSDAYKKLNDLVERRFI